MELQSVSALTIASFIFTLLVSIVLPIALLILMRIKLKARISSFFIGCATFVVFALILEQLLHLLVLTTAGAALEKNIFLYALYGAAAASVFEETGRFLAMKFVMRKRLSRENALMFGAGHGGIEAILIVGLVYINNLIIAFMINTGLMESSLAVLEPSMRDAAVQSLVPLWLTPASTFFLAGVERLLTIFLHICLSVLVYKAVSGKKLFLLPAYGIHFLVDFAVVIAAKYLPLVWAELLLLVMVAATAAFTAQVYKKEASAS